MNTVILSITCADPSLLPEGDLSGIIAALSVGGIAPVLSQEANVMREWQRANFASDGSVFGEPWAALSPRTIATKTRQGFSAAPLIREGHLQAALGETSQYDGNNVTTGIDLAAVPYASFQQNTSAHKPGRIIVAVSSGEVQEIETCLQDYLEETLGPAAQAFQITTEIL